MYYIAVMNENGTYSIDEAVVDWHEAIDKVEPIDCLDGGIVVYNDDGHKYLIGPAKDLVHKKILWVFNSVEVGKWDFNKGEPYLIDTNQIVPDELALLINDFKKRH